MNSNRQNNVQITCLLNGDEEIIEVGLIDC
jgi:hypothetical protein